MTKKHEGRRARAETRASSQSPRDASRADPAPPPEEAEKPVQQSARPWKEWKRIPLRARAGKDDYPVIFEVSGLDAKRNAHYSALITAAAHKHFKIAAPPREDEGPAAYSRSWAGAGKLRVVYDEVIVQFEPHVGAARSNAVIAEAGFHGRAERPRRAGGALVKDQWVVSAGSRRIAAPRGRPVRAIRGSAVRVAELRGGVPPGERWGAAERATLVARQDESQLFVGQPACPQRRRRCRYCRSRRRRGHLSPEFGESRCPDPGRDFDLLPGEAGHEDPSAEEKNPLR